MEIDAATADTHDTADLPERQDADTVNIDDHTDSQGTADDFFEMALPPVTQEEGGYIDDEPEPEPEDPSKNDNDLREDYTPAIEEYRGVKDEKGNPFDPALHVFPPEKTAGGKWRRIPKKERDKRLTTGQTSEGIEAPESNASNRLDAQKMAAMYAGLHSSIYGVENARPNPAYFNDLTDSIEQYFNEHGSIELPASVQLIMSAGLYSHEISTRESNIQKTRNLIGGIFGKIKGLFKRKEKKVDELKKNAEDSATKKEEDNA
ncbi:MAG: hypothetical protein V6Z82_06975 [Flavobacteriales bacterium]